MDEKCFACGKAGKCIVLHEYRCPGQEACRFYKLPFELERSRRLADVRLRTLSAEQQMHIAEKYHGGQMPWKDGRK